MKKIRRFLIILFDYLLAILFFPVFYVYSYFVRNENKDKPKVVWGLFPYKPTAYNSTGLKLHGIESYTYMDNIPPIYERNDFDYYFYDNLKSTKNSLLLLFRYLNFFKILKNFNVLILSFDGGYLRFTKLMFLEHIFWKIAKKKIIVWPYGGDSFVFGKMNDFTFRYGLTKSYPELPKRDKQIRKQIDYFTEHSDFVVGNLPHCESCPKWDIVTVACYSVDTEEWKPDVNFKHCRNGIDNEVIIVHCPNHRAVKGTNFLVEAVNNLTEEGLKIDLRILEKTDNKTVLEEMKKCDIIAAQFLYGYAATEIEGMSLAKPVLSNLESGYYNDVARRYTYVINCPIVSTSPENIKDNLRMLITNPKLREETGNKSRKYVEKYHSVEGMGLMWSKIVNKVFYDSNEELDNWWKER